MPEGFNSIADLKVVIDANTEGLKGGLELAQGLISRFRGDADKDLGLFDQIMTKGSASVMTWIGRLNAVSAGLTIAGQAIDVFKEQGRKFAEETGTVEQFEKLSGSVDDLQAAIVGGLKDAAAGAATSTGNFVSSLAAFGDEAEASQTASVNLAAVLQEKVAAAIDTVSFAIRKLGPDATKSLQQLEREVTHYTEMLRQARDTANDLADARAVEDAFLPGIPDEEKLARQKQYIAGLEMSKWVAEQLLGIEKIGKDADDRKKREDEAAAAIEGHVKSLDKEIKSLELKAAVLGMTAAEMAAYTTRQRIMNDLEEKGADLTDKAKGELDQRIGRIRSLTAQVEAYNKAQQDRANAERQGQQVRRIIEGLDAEIDAQGRKADAFGRTAAEAAALERRERALLAIRQAGREPTEAEIAQIDAKTEALREQIEVYDRTKRAQDQLREYTRIVTSTMEDAFRDFTRGAKIDVKEMVRSMLQDLAMLTLKQSVTGPLQQGLGSILGSLFGGGAAGAAILGAAGGAAGGGAAVIPAFADGGRPPLDRPSLIGERGPELWMPDIAGRVVSNEDLRDIVAGGGQGPRAGGEIVVKVAAGPELYVEIDNRADGIVTRRMPAIQAETLRQTRSALPAMLGDVRSRNNV